jgi:cyclopropane fatty-acyl-phospholipid synthase-like methyltransferase
MKVIEEKPAGRALDLGCGTGTNLLTLADRGWTVTGVDLALLSVLKARRKLRQAGHKAHIFQGDVTHKLLPDQQFDLILDMGCFHNLSPEGKALYRQNIQRWLAPGGTYLVYAHKKRRDRAFHGVDEHDFQAFEATLDLTWRKDTAEERPDGGGGSPSVWARFDRPAGE